MPESQTYPTPFDKSLPHSVIIMTKIIHELENVYAINFERITPDKIMYIVHFSSEITVIIFVVLPIVLLNFYMQIFYTIITLVQWDNEITAVYNIVLLYVCITAIYSSTLFSPCSLAANRDFSLSNSSLLSLSSSLKPSIFSSSWFCIWRRSARTESPAPQF